MPTREETNQTRRRVLKAKAKHPTASFRELGRLAGCSHTRAYRILAQAARDFADQFGGQPSDRLGRRLDYDCH